MTTPDHDAAFVAESRWCHEVSVHPPHEWNESGRSLSCPGVPLNDSQSAAFSVRNLRSRFPHGGWVNVRRGELDALLDVVEAARALQGPDLSAWAFIGWQPSPETKAQIDAAFERLEATTGRFS